MTKINLDKYYTSVALADYCINKTYEIIGKENITEIIEPSAGNGSFSLQIPDCIAYDIKPEHESIIKQDYLKLELEYKKGRLIIGNPPFGKGNYLSVQFFKNAIKQAQFIAFILPISQLNNNMYFYEYDLIHSEDLNKQDYSNLPIHCCLNIYKKPIHEWVYNKKPIFELNDISLKGVAKGKSRNDKIPSRYNLSISGFGASVGKFCDYEYQYCQQIYVTINNLKLKDKIIDLLAIADWKSLYNMTATPKLKHWMIIKHLKEQIPEIK